MEDTQSVSHSVQDPIPEQYPAIWKQRLAIAGVSLLVLLILAAIVLAIVSMVKSPQQTQTIRDIVIIFMAVEALIVGMALIVLIIQLARLTALIQNEVRPILDATNQTLSTLRGTTTFLSDNIANPVVKLNSSVAALMRFVELIGLRRSE
ncbi:MAG TPA: hypothetical protein G4O08_06820 [Anaerolineae bacterium]|nr:hypothetical protein [Anaerolineae bacterium]